MKNVGFKNGIATIIKDGDSHGDFDFVIHNADLSLVDGVFINYWKYENGKIVPMNKKETIKYNMLHYGKKSVHGEPKNLYNKNVKFIFDKVKKYFVPTLVLSILGLILWELYGKK